jgi:PEP-CTERM motif
VPEPSTWAMMLLGFAGLGYAGMRNRRRPAISIA